MVKALWKISILQQFLLFRWRRLSSLLLAMRCIRRLAHRESSSAILLKITKTKMLCRVCSFLGRVALIFSHQTAVKPGGIA